MMTDIFQECRERVSARAVAERYGIEIQRDFAKCPFHGEKTASLHFHDGGFYCFGCHAGGSSIDFTARLYGLDNIGAVRQLNEDFALGLTLDRPATPENREKARKRKEEQEAHRRFEKWRQQTINDLNHCHRIAHRAQPPFTAQDVLALKWKDYCTYLADLLRDGTPEEQMEVFRMRGDVNKLTQQILGNMPMK